MNIGNVGFESGGGFAQSQAFTCYIADAKVIKCVHGPTWSRTPGAGIGLPSLGQWTAGSTYIAYGDAISATTRLTGIMGTPGGQTLTTAPGVTATLGSGYTSGVYAQAAMYAQPSATTVPTYNSGTGIMTITFATAPYGAAIGSQANGSLLTMINLGGTLGAKLNGSFAVTGTSSSGTVVTVQAPTGLGTGTVTVAATPANVQTLASSCGIGAVGVAPIMDFTVENSGGVVNNIYPSASAGGGANAVGNGINGAGTFPNQVCSFFLTQGGGTGASITIPMSPLEGFAGVGGYAGDQNLMGLIIYDNSWEPGSANAPFAMCPFMASGYCEPGIPLRGFGWAVGMQVSEAGGDPTAGVLSAFNDANPNWVNAGMSKVGGIPVRNTTCATLSPRGGVLDDTAQIQAAINSCPNNEVVQLNAGTFRVAPSGSGSIFITNPITVRGSTCTNGSSPYCSTVINVTPSGATLGSSSNGTSPYGDVFVVGADNGHPFYSPVDYGNWNTPTTLTADAAQGATSVAVASTSGFSVGQWVLIDEASGAGYVADPMIANGGSYPTGGQVWAAPDWLNSSGGPAATGKVAYLKHNPTISSIDEYGATDYPYQHVGNSGCWFSMCDRETSEMHLITNITGNVITFDDPLTVSYRMSGGTSFTGSISGTTLTTSAGTPVIGQEIEDDATGHAVALGTYVVSGSGTTWTVLDDAAGSQTVTSRAMHSGVHAARLYSPASTIVTGVGIENMTIEHSTGGAVMFNMAAYCWTKNLEVSTWLYGGVNMVYAARVEVNENYIHTAASPATNGTEYPTDEQFGSTEDLVVNSVLLYGGKIGTTRAAGAGSVFAYNYGDDPLIQSTHTWIEDAGAVGHNGGSHQSLMEGNWYTNGRADNTHGNIVYMSEFRNYLPGYRQTFVDAISSSTINDQTTPGNGPLGLA